MKRGQAFTHRVSIESRATTLDTFGQRTDTWSNLFDCWANVRPLSGRELLLAQSIHPEVTGEVEIRYRAAMAATAGADKRVLFQGRYLSVLAVIDDDEAHLCLRLLYAEGLHKL